MARSAASALDGAPSTREKLIAAAFRVVARDGLAEANVKAIAAEAGVTAGLLHYHFASKDALLEAAVAQGTQSYLFELDRLIAAHDSADLLDAYVRFVEATVDAHRDLFRVRLALSVRAMNDGALSASMAAGNAQVRDRIAIILARAAGREAVEPVDDLRARMVKAAFEGMMLSWLSQDDFPMRAAMAEWTAMMRDRVIQSA